MHGINILRTTQRQKVYMFTFKFYIGIYVLYDYVILILIAGKSAMTTDGPSRLNIEAS